MKTSLRGEMSKMGRVTDALHPSFRGPKDSRPDTNTMHTLHSSNANIFSLIKPLIKAEFFSQINKGINVGEWKYNKNTVHFLKVFSRLWDKP